MNSKELPDLTFIQNPTPAQLQQAAAENHLHWMRQLALVAGGEIRQEDGATWIYSPASEGEVIIAFPRLTERNASERLEAIMAYCRQRSLQQVACWSLDPTQPPDLGARLAARGFEWGWRPHWMWLDFQKMLTDHAKPHRLQVGLVEDEEIWDAGVDDLPYYSYDYATHLQALARLHPRRVWHFAAWLDGKPVGHSALHLTTGRLGVAGIFNCGVVPIARNRGIGKAVTLAACQFAQAMGCPGALLNATDIGVPMYRSLGFESVGYGQTWWLFRKTLESPPPTKAQVALTEAVGRGDVETLNRLGQGVNSETLDTPTTNGMTLMQLAVKMGQLVAAEWLIEHGATLDVLSAWELGWRDRVPQLLADSPELANARFGNEQMTPLHSAAIRNDTELARLILTAKPDLSIDNNDAGTPLHQAAWFGHLDIVKLLLEHNPPLETTNRYGGTPLRTAVYGSVHSPNRAGDYAGVVESLITAGAKVPPTASGSEAVAEVLRRYGARD